MSHDENYEVLGDQVMRDLAGPEGIGFDPTFLVNAASELASGGIKAKQDSDAAAKATKDTQAAAQKAISADASWADAETQLDLAQQSKDSTRIAAASTLQSQSYAAAMSAGAGLSGDAQSKRTQAAQDAARKAAQDSLSNPKDMAKAARMRAWQKVSMGGNAGGGLAPSTGGGGMEKHKGGGEEPSFFTKMHAGVPMWGWLVGGTTVVVGGGLLLRHFLRRK